MKCGDIILVKNNKLISKIIKWWTKSEYSHSAIAIDELHMYETNYNTKAHIKHSDYPRDMYDVYRLNPEIELDTERLKKFMLKNIGNDYDFGEILKIVFKKNTKDDDGDYICSMLVRDALLEQGIDLTPGIEIPSPEDLKCSKLLYKVENE